MGSGKPAHAATETTDLTAELKRGLSYIRQRGSGAGNAFLSPISYKENNSRFGSLVTPSTLPFRPAQALSRSNSFAGRSGHRSPLLDCLTARRSCVCAPEATQSCQRCVQLLHLLLRTIPFRL
jgi:hypothetical protein